MTRKLLSSLPQVHDLAEPARIGPLVCAFTIDARPTPKGRPRFGNGRTYTDPKTVAFEAMVSLKASGAMKGQPPYTGPVRLIALFEQADKRRSDIDNHLKALLDGISKRARSGAPIGPVLADDSQVVEIRARLVRGAECDRITVLVEETA